VRTNSHRHARRKPGIHDFLDPADAGVITANPIRQPNLAAGRRSIFTGSNSAWPDGLGHCEIYIPTED